MLKEVSAFSLIIFLFVILASFWALMSFRASSPGVFVTDTSSTIDNSYVVASPVRIYHATAQGAEVYSGSISIPNCDEFLTGISAFGSQPAHLRLSFAVSRPSGTCVQTPGALEVPFSVTFSSSDIKKKPVLDSVKINNTAAAFSIIESK